MNLQELQAEITYLTTTRDAIGLTLYVVYNDENNLEQVRIADIDGQSAQELKVMFLGSLNEKVLQNGDLTMINISNGDNRNNTIHRYDLDEPLQGLDSLEIVARNGDIPQFSFRGDDFNNIKAFIVEIGNETRKVTLYKKHHHLSVLRGAQAFGMRVSNHRFVRVREDIIKLSPQIDFMKIENNLFVLNLKTLESGFGYEGIIRNKANENILAIGRLDLLEDIDVLNEMALDIKQAKRIMRINMNSPVMNLPAIAVLRFVQTHRPIMRKFRLSPDNSRLRLDTNVSKKLFLALMNDDLLTSELTRLYYEGIAKDQMIDND